MRFKLKYKSCLWNRTDIWGNLHSKKQTFLRPKWDALIGIASSKLYKKQKYCLLYKFSEPNRRPNSVFSYPRYGYRNLLSSKFCLQRFYGDIKYSYLQRLCKRKTLLESYSCLEGRLDRVLVSLGLFKSILLSRQFIRHRKILVNSKIISFGNYILKKGDVIEINPKFKMFVLTNMEKNLKKRAKKQKRIVGRGKKLYKIKPTPNWIQTDYKSLRFIISNKVDYSSSFHPFRIKFDEFNWMVKSYK